MPDSVSERADYNRELRTIAKGSGMQLIGQFAQHLMGVIVGPVIARLLGIAGYGLLSLARGILEGLGLILKLGYPNAISRYVSMYDGEGRGEHARGVVMGTLSTSVAAGCVVASMLVLWPDSVSVGIYRKPAMSPLLQILALSLPVLLIAGHLAQATVARRTMFYTVAGGLVGRIVVLTGSLVLCGALGLGIKGAAFALLVSWAVQALVSLMGAVRLFGALDFADLRYYGFARVNLFALPLLLSQLSQFGLFRVNRVIGGRWLSAADLGKYSAAMQLATIGTFGVTSIGAIFGPIIADLHHRGKIEELREMYQTATRWAYHMSVPILLVAIFKADSALSIWGPRFVDAALVLRVLCIGQFMNVSVGSASIALAMCGHNWVVAANNLSMAALNVVLCILLTRGHGLMGLALAATVATSAVNLLRAGQLWGLHRVTAYTPKACKPLLAGALTCPLLLVRFQPWPVDLIVPVAAFVGAYVLAVVLVGLEPDDRAIYAAVRDRLAARDRGPRQTKHHGA